MLQLIALLFYVELLNQARYSPLLLCKLRKEGVAIVFIHVEGQVDMHHLLPLSAVRALPFSALVLIIFTAGRALPLITAGRGLVTGGRVFLSVVTYCLQTLFSALSAGPKT